MGMDMGALNICIWREFQIGVTGSPTGGYTVRFKFNIGSFIINVIFDCPHILKAIRNASMKYVLYITREYMEKYNLKTTDVNFKWIVKIVEIDAKHQLNKAKWL